MRSYRLIGRSGLPEKCGRLFAGRPFRAQTLGPFIFVPGTTIAPHVLKHELVHVTQWYVGTMIAVAAWLLVRPSAWLLLLCPLAFSIAYALASLVAWLSGEHPYRQNWFEVQARRKAGEP